MKPITFKQFIDTFDFYKNIPSDNSMGFDSDTDIIRIYPDIFGEYNDKFWFEFGILDGAYFSKTQMLDSIFSKNILDSVISKIYRDDNNNLCIVLENKKGGATQNE